MKNAKELLEDFFKASWRDPKVMVGMFAEDGGLELPYLTDFGYPERFAGAEVAEKGKIRLVREAMNSAEVARAVFKQGIPELPPRTSAGRQ